MPQSSTSGLQWLARCASSKASKITQRLPSTFRTTRSPSQNTVFIPRSKKPDLHKQRILFSHNLWRVRQRWNGFKSTLRPQFRENVRTFMWLLPWIPIVAVIDRNYYTIMRIKGPSMTPALNRDYKSDEPNLDDRVLIDLRYPSAAQRGDIVAFRSPQDPEKIVVKRIIAVQGDQVTPIPPYPADPLIVQWGQVWVEGDNEDKSQTKDSNWYGPISRGLIVGRALAIIWPWNHYEILPRRTEIRHPRVVKRAVALQDPGDVRIERQRYWEQEIAKVEQKRAQRESGQATEESDRSTTSQVGSSV